MIFVRAVLSIDSNEFTRGIHDHDSAYFPRTKALLLLCLSQDRRVSIYRVLLYYYYYYYYFLSVRHVPHTLPLLYILF